MRSPRYTKRFQKDVERSKRRGQETSKLKHVIELIVSEAPLPPRLRDHALVGNYVGRRECHIEPDWLLIYKLDDDKVVIFERTGSHSDLF
ncbi:type II toxin-antitoxin system mRNA interferase toxin, RelE/StbE family [Lamprobacter modestohalophilus]|uniref:Type II toxin-antitoxin system mRNA interferase toxin, RelE/StbE family n=1 Tax=Lamprobacter modestohalophilus TaxID=1064514 RepID=A0A9X1B4S4_9GAMM|nr:type II toxin-antitoxin system mRNA interferase toxin, RelE/StbE family [Lamprobacter modestohalophilus]MCF7978668.1 type II toxin-antitoxin system YafQ family toxin [Chromatiaceae bacterium]MCF7993365.1 type II toxin-antitoxin system YafQ family toxin [Chromatiaceae bacterium]MCF8002824.1 type II toxin-antitoxin system YafQ family toxin [Chromatiaceae bacterium]MCF8015684.1 type II toxin-antitoxin system YafQ family toxin [Chromatiaceae bacterium]